jgi:hypothetical protein
MKLRRLMLGEWSQELLNCIVMLLKVMRRRKAHSGA